jgi:hypothetical protein
MPTNKLDMARLFNSFAKMFKAVPDLDGKLDDLADHMPGDIWNDPRQVPTREKLMTSGTALRASGTGASDATHEFSRDAHVGDRNNSDGQILAQLLGEMATLKANQSAMAGLLAQWAKAFPADQSEHTADGDEDEDEPSDKDEDEAAKSLSGEQVMTTSIADLMTRLSGRRVAKVAKVAKVKKPEGAGLRVPPAFNTELLKSSSLENLLDEAQDRGASNAEMLVIQTRHQRQCAAAAGRLAWDRVEEGLGGYPAMHADVRRALIG